jgi:hypothetical protein
VFYKFYIIEVIIIFKEELHKNGLERRRLQIKHHVKKKQARGVTKRIEKKNICFRDNKYIFTIEF